MKAKTKIFPVLMLLATLLKPESKSMSAAQEQKLYVNTSPTHYVIEKSEEEGQKDIRELVFNSEFEEAWAYVESKNVGDKNVKDRSERGRGGVWYEVGINRHSSPKSIGMCIKYDSKETANNTEALENCINVEKFKLDKIIFYHFHPATCDAFFYFSETPSEEDIASYYNIASALYKKDYNDIQGKIVVSSGIYTMKFNKNELIKDEKKSKDIIITKIKEYFFYRTQTFPLVFPDEEEFGSFEKPDNFKCEPDINVNKKTAEFISIPGFLEVTFEPHDEEFLKGFPKIMKKK